ncbi:C-terminal beta- propeller domain-contain secreted protein-like protein [Desulfofarcimen acetoxidans DSM 771]|uniref:C-terminal beta-propeller domain-contain secreted protein-like protein n=1 Tax=Desulfofarcimen acetoxidans (strain ATCC 49208 / DSM 771 / KCTC 5769 / VKM B-1644 / 5575) TaxID=485916 RepID=C8W5U2_DESAS|nr:beta-propeller domain-containing protein [Desulfofarcimen acetoxidans]ACV64092.1 C-terminal beta- propeller domain-contain secreted protein-like protein [Desulfofarcimen acetoxidans DSM 771]
MKGKVAIVGKLWPLLVCILLILTVNSMASEQPAGSSSGQLKSFPDYEQLSEYIKNSNKVSGVFGLSTTHRGLVMEESLSLPLNSVDNGFAMKADMAVNQKKASAAKEKADFSETNNQVRGVDEADLVKTDGSYIYLVNNGKLVILQAYPAQEAKKLTEISFDGRPQEIFIDGDSLLVFGSSADRQKMFLRKYDIADRKSPLMLQELTCDGNYVTSRKIGENVYAVINTPVYRYNEATGQNIALPVFTNNGIKKIVQPKEIYYFDRTDSSYNYSIMASVSMKKDSKNFRSRIYLTGTSQNIFASENNIYLTGNKSPDYEFYGEKLYKSLLSLMPEQVQSTINESQASCNTYAQRLQILEEIAGEYLISLDYRQASAIEEKINRIVEGYRRDIERENNKTVIYKLAVDAGQVVYKCKGEVDGYVLNQFSMDEHNGYFRIATTSQGSWSITGQSPAPKNNIYVLDENMQITGKLLGLAVNERIFSARFMGERAYLVTFRKTDPLFVIDLKDPAFPRVAGELKIPGYSDYLHPYDENHIIGIGKEVVERLPGQLSQKQMIIEPVSREKGVKIALFDVSNPAAPKEMSKYVVESDNSDSAALHDHRAVLFSREKNLLVLPVSDRLFRIAAQQKHDAYEQPWQGAYAFKVSLEEGIKLMNKVEHRSEVRRSLYIENVLYTMSDAEIKLNDLTGLREIKEIALQ